MQGMSSTQCWLIPPGELTVHCSALLSLGLLVGQHVFLSVLYVSAVIQNFRHSGNTARYIRRSCHPNAEVSDLFLSLSLSLTHSLTLSLSLSLSFLYSSTHFVVWLCHQSTCVKFIHVLFGYSTLKKFPLLSYAHRCDILWWTRRYSLAYLLWNLSRKTRRSRSVLTTLSRSGALMSFIFMRGPVFVRCLFFFFFRSVGCLIDFFFISSCNFFVVRLSA